VLSAVGISTNLEGLGLEEAGVKTDKGLVVTDDYDATNVPGVYAIGDIVKGPALAHVASAEGITCVEKAAGVHVQPIDYSNIPSCTYCWPEVASVGLTEAEAKEKGYQVKVGKFLSPHRVRHLHQALKTASSRSYLMRNTVSGLAHI
jgi:dihydrolipoamide dehydrogenase